MNINPEHCSNNETDVEWPMFLTQELRQQLIEAKIARVLATLDSRKKVKSVHVPNCNQTNCECH